MLAGKTLVLGVTGGIAAYQMADLIGGLKRRMVTVYVVMSRAATNFITPLTLGAIAGCPVMEDRFPSGNHRKVQPPALAGLTDLVLIAPATANFLGKLAHGVGDDLLLATVLATRAPALLAPAMNERMYTSPAVQHNIQTLQEYGYHFIGPDYGEMLCGGEGWGRLARLDAIINKLAELAKSVGKENSSSSLQEARRGKP